MNLRPSNYLLFSVSRKSPRRHEMASHFEMRGKLLMCVSFHFFRTEWQICSSNIHVNRATLGRRNGRSPNWWPIRLCAAFLATIPCVWGYRWAQKFSCGVGGCWSEACVLVLWLGELCGLHPVAPSASEYRKSLKENYSYCFLNHDLLKSSFGRVQVSEAITFIQLS